MKSYPYLVVWCLIPLLLLSSCRKKVEEAPEVIRPVVTMLTPQAGEGRARGFSGTAKAAVETPLSFRVSGTLIDLPIKLGQVVKAGAVIARLDSTDYELQVKQQEAQLAQADAQLEQARSEYERSRQLYEAENVSKSELDSQQAYFKSAVAQKEAAKKGLELANQQWGYCTLHAPIDGAIASVPVEEHQTVQAGVTIASLSAGKEIHMLIGIPELLISKVKLGDVATVTFEAVREKTFTATVNEVGIELTSSSTYPVTLALHDLDERIRAGMIGEAVLVFDRDLASVIYVPSVAVVGDSRGEKYVWIVDPSTMRVSKRIVKIGDMASEGLQITEGLNSDEYLVTRGVHRLQEGMKVRLLNR